MVHGARVEVDDDGEGQQLRHLARHLALPLAPAQHQVQQASVDADQVRRRAVGEKRAHLTGGQGRSVEAAREAAAGGGAAVAGEGRGSEPAGRGEGGER